MNLRFRQREETRRAILDALATVIVESGGVGFSVQQVADRAGVTHRTVYNHFPTREALNDGLATHVEELLATDGRPTEPSISLERLAPMTGELYQSFEECEVPVRAYVMLMVASRGPAQVAREHTSAIEALIERETSVAPPLDARGLTAAVRMFLSSTGWHLLTEHLGLSSDEAATTATWATQALLDAGTRHPSPTGRRKGRKR